MKIILGLLLAAGLAVPSDKPVFEVWSAAQIKGYAVSLRPKLNSFKVASQPLANYGDHLIMVIHREGKGEAELHKKQADVMFIESGEAMIVVGGTMVGAKDVNPDEVRAPSIQNGETRLLNEGDVVHIPSNTPHQVIVQTGKQITYAIVKVND